MKYSLSIGRKLIAYSAIFVILQLQGCSKDSAPAPMTLADKAVTGLDYHYNSGSVAPDYAYQVSYFIDYQTKTRVISVTKGNSVTAPLPTPGTIALTDQQLAQIRSLFNQITVILCPLGAPLVGGGTTRIDIFTTSASVVDSSISISDCTGFTGSSAYQSTAAATQPLTDYVVSL